MYVSIGEAALALGVCTKTLRRWESKQQLSPSFRTAGAHRRYAKEVIDRLKSTPNEAAAEEPRPTLTYARVSSHDQVGDLKRQTQTLRSYCTREKELAEDKVVSGEDVGSGMNFKKKGLRTVLKAVLGKEIAEVVVAYPDRLTRFGFELIRMVCEFQGVRLTVLEEKQAPAVDQLGRDLIEIITVFSSRLYGQRSASHRQKAQSNKQVL